MTLKVALNILGSAATFPKHLIIVILVGWIQLCPRNQRRLGKSRVRLPVTISLFNHSENCFCMLGRSFPRLSSARTPRHSPALEAFSWRFALLWEIAEVAKFVTALRRGLLFWYFLGLLTFLSLTVIYRGFSNCGLRGDCHTYGIRLLCFHFSQHENVC